MSCKCDVCGNVVPLEDLVTKDRWFTFIPKEKDACKNCLDEVQAVANRVYEEQKANSKVLIDHAVASFFARKEQHLVGP